MGRFRRKHSREFKLEAVKQVAEQGRSISEVADGLGVNRNLLACARDNGMGSYRFALQP